MTEAEARRILGAAGVDPSEVRKLARLADDTGENFAELVMRRADREPFSHIAGHRAFWTHQFRVTPDVLDPRPETERLVELALAEPFAKVLDLGTGSGCIVISLLAARPEAKGVGTDISEQAVLIAGENAKAIGVADRLVLPLSEWFDDVGGRFDLIVSNPPYIAAAEMAGLQPEVRDHEPHLALTDGADGLTAYRVIAAQVRDHLRPGGRVLVEIGATQGTQVAALFSTAGLADVRVHTDLNGKDRVVEARMPTPNPH
ncbi:MAG: peptide chain release factor N(5)-glutamine methyltransferase [Pseudomonadota bacterium]